MSGPAPVIGIAIIAVIYTAAFVSCARSLGWREASVIFGSAIGLVGLIGLAAYLIVGAS